MSRSDMRFRVSNGHNGRGVVRAIEEIENDKE